MKKYDKIGIILMIIGLIITLLALIIGFTAMFFDPKHILVKLIGIVPIGFLMVFVGLSMSVLHGEPRSPAMRPPDLDEDD